MLMVITGTALLILNKHCIAEQQGFNIINGTRGVVKLLYFLKLSIVATTRFHKNICFIFSSFLTEMLINSNEISSKCAP